MRKPSILWGLAMGLVMPLAMAGCSDPSPEPAEDGRTSRQESAPVVDLQILAWDFVEVDATAPAAVSFDVPEGTLRMMVLWQNDESVYSGPTVRWTDAGGCEGEALMSSTVGIDLGRHNGSNAVVCSPEPGSHVDAVLSIPLGTTRGTFTVVAAVAVSALADSPEIPA